MKYLNKFDTRSDYQASASTLEIPNVAYITATTEVIYNTNQKEYITFADQAVGQRCILFYSTDGVGCTEEDLGAVTAISASDWSGTSITSFDELGYFTGLTSIPDNAFYECSGLTSVTIPDSVTEIRQNAFLGNNLQEVSIPDSVTQVWYSAFYNNTGLTSVTIGSSVSGLSSYAFYNCPLESITFMSETPPTYRRDEATFHGQAATGDITVPEGYESNFYDLAQTLGSGWTVNGLTPVNYVQFADPTVSSICVSNWSSDGTGCTQADLGAVSSLNNKFAGKTAITSFDEFQYFTGVSLDGYDFMTCSGMTSITLPPTLTATSEYMLANCLSLSSITIPSGVTSIGEGSFAACHSLTSMTIPSGVTSIGQEAFTICSGLTSMTFNTTTPPTIGSDAFSNLPSTGNITVPVGSESNYFSLAQSIGANWTVNNQTPPALNYVLFEATATTAASDVTELTLGGVTISGNSYGTGGVMFNYTNGYRFYKNCSFDIIATGGNITKIEFTQVSSSYPATNLSPVDSTIGTYTVADGVGTWVASSAVSTVSFTTSSGACRCTSIKVYLE